MQARATIVQARERYLSAWNQLGVQPKCVQRAHIAYMPCSLRMIQTRWDLVHRVDTPTG